MGAIKSKIIDDSTTLDHVNEINKEAQRDVEMIKNSGNNNNDGVADQLSVTIEPKKIFNQSIDDDDEDLSENIANLNINNKNNLKQSKNSSMHSVSAASFQPPDFLQRSQYFRSFRSASKRFFTKKTSNEPTISFSKTDSPINENDASNKTTTNNRNYFYRSFKNLNRNNLNCISNLSSQKESYIVEDTDVQMNASTSWFRNLKSKSHADLDTKRKMFQTYRNTPRNNIKEESPQPSKFPTPPQQENLSSKSFESIPNLGFTVVEIDPSEIKNEHEIKNSKKIDSSSPSSSSSASSTGMYSRTSNHSINNSKSYEQVRKIVQIPIKITTEPPMTKQQQQANLFNQMFLNELNKLNDLSKKNDSLVQNFKSEVETLSRLLDVFNREDPKSINELLQKTEAYIKQAEKIKSGVDEQLKIKNKNSQMNRFTNQVIIKLYEDCIVRLDKQNEILGAQVTELNSIKQFLVHVAAVYNQHSSRHSPPSYGYSENYYPQNNTDGYFQNFHNYQHQQQNNYFFNPRNNYQQSSHYYVNPGTAYVEQPAFYYTYNTQPASANLYFDATTGQYFYRKPHVHTHTHPHVHTHTHAHPNGTQYFTHNGQSQYANGFMKNHQNYFNPSDVAGKESPTNNGAIITEVSDDEDDYLRNRSDKKKDYVDAISLNGDE